MTGYTCIRCGSFVPFGVWHQCPQPPPPLPIDLTPLYRIAAALERIADSLVEKSQ